MISKLQNQSRQPTPGARLGCIPASLAGVAALIVMREHLLICALLGLAV